MPVKTPAAREEAHRQPLAEPRGQQHLGHREHVARIARQVAHAHRPAAAQHVELRQLALERRAGEVLEQRLGVPVARQRRMAALHGIPARELGAHERHQSLELRQDLLGARRRRQDVGGRTSHARDRGELFGG